MFLVCLSTLACDKSGLWLGLVPSSRRAISWAWNLGRLLHIHRLSAESRKRSNQAPVCETLQARVDHARSLGSPSRQITFLSHKRRPGLNKPPWSGGSAPRPSRSHRRQAPLSRRSCPEHASPPSTVLPGARHRAPGPLPSKWGLATNISFAVYTMYI